MRSSVPEREANPKHWRATFMLTEPGGEDCTATAVAADVVLTAAHCLTKSLQGRMVAGDRSISCTRHDRWNGGPDADFALCIVDPPFQATPAGFEVIDINEDRPPLQAKITLLGFGCRMAGGVDRGYGTLAQGDATLVARSAAYLETAGNATVCPGDSGGGAFWTEDTAGIRRRLVAINSSTDLQELSQLSRTSNPEFLAQHVARSR